MGAKRVAGRLGCAVVLASLAGACGSADPPVRAWSCASSVVCGSDKAALPAVETCEPRERAGADVGRRLSDVCAAAASASCPGAVCLVYCERTPSRDGACAPDGG